MNTPQIIRTTTELDNLDAETVICSMDGTVTQIMRIDPDYGEEFLPAVVIDTGEQVRAARKALQGEA